jgi:hypothetical protein
VPIIAPLMQKTRNVASRGLIPRSPSRASVSTEPCPEWLFVRRAEDDRVIPVGSASRTSRRTRSPGAVSSPEHLSSKEGSAACPRQTTEQAD